MNILNCLIVDDDAVSRVTTRNFITQTPGLNFVAECANAAEAFKALSSFNIDLIFLDVEMPEMSGLEFLDNLKSAPQTILITSKKEYALDAFDYNVTDFLVKPVEYSRFLKAGKKAQEMAETIKKSASKEEIYIKKDSVLMKVDCKEIFLVEALADYVNIYTETQRHTILSTMKGIESKLPAKDFARVHRSYIVRLDKVKSIEDNTISIAQKTIPISRSYKDSFMRRLNTL